MPTSLLDALAVLGAWSGPALWLPVAAWTLLALPAWALARRRSAALSPLVRYRLAQALLAALPLGLVAAALTHALVGALAWTPPALLPADLAARLPALTVSPTAATDAPGAATPTLAHALGLLTLAAGLAAAVAFGRLALHAAALRRLLRRHPLVPAPAAVQALAAQWSPARPVRVLVTPRDGVPLVVPGRRPHVVLPAALLGDDEALRLALRHECIHARRRDDLAHVAESVLAAASAVHPGVRWLVREAARLRELACDAAVLADAAPAARSAYARLLATFTDPALVAPPVTVALAEPSSLLHTRLTAMLSTPSTTPSAMLRLRHRLGLLALLAACTLGIVACTEGVTSEPGAADEAVTAAPPDTSEVFVVVGDMPAMKGGPTAVYEHVSYPDEALAAKVEGLVIVRFIVNKDGSVSDVEVVRSAHPALDAEAVEAIQQVTFEPGREDGEVVRVLLTQPIRFALD